ncbi:hypothetical protein HYW40_02945 [Candidatus Curtissbacteria bacterium]|nr:hypothetical protein [Candidatus Curtissbacteria bacterium]
MKNIAQKPKVLFFLLIALALTTLIIIQNQKPQPINPKPPSNNPSRTDEIRDISRGLYEECRRSQAACFEQKITDRLLAKYAVADILEAVYDWDVYFSCHAFTHFLGQALYKKTGSIPDAYSQVNFTCHGGTYHGVLEAFLDARKTTVDSLTGKDLETTCADSPKKSGKNTSQIFTECLHGFGHAFMFITNADLPSSLAYCDRLDASLRERCWGGAFMENSTSSTNADHPTNWLKAEDKFYPCTVLPAGYLKQCYFYQANYLLKITSRNWQRVFADCAEVAAAAHHDYCVLGLGAQLASVSNEEGIDVAASVCPLGQGNDQYVCVEGAVPSLFARHGGAAPQVFEFCRQLAPFLREFCFAKLGSVAKTYWQYDQASLESTCLEAKEFAYACMGLSNNSFKY